LECGLSGFIRKGPQIGKMQAAGCKTSFPQVIDRLPDGAFSRPQPTSRMSLSSW
jgi:hypothetical protein